MISNYDFLINNFNKLINFPILVSLSPLIGTGLIYLFGKIRSSNYWQYHLDNKYVPFLHGIVVLNNFIFVPIILILFFYYLFFNFKQMFTLSFISLFLLIIFLNIIQRISKQLIKWNKSKSSENTESDLINIQLNQLVELFTNWKNLLKLLLMKYVFPVILYLLIFFVLKVTYNRMIYLLTGFIWLLSIIYFSMLDTKLEQHKTYDLVVKDKKLQNVKIIEFLNNGALLKYQDNKGNVKVIPSSCISEIILSRRD